VDASRHWRRPAETNEHGDIGRQPTALFFNLLLLNLLKVVK